MKQIVQNYKSGILKAEEVPYPLLKPGNILIQNKCSLISTGTERSKINLASKNILVKAKTRPDQVKMVMNNLKQEGIAATIKKALIKLDTPISLGYSCSGDTIEVSSEIKEFKPGDRVACMGEGMATHAEINSVLKNLCVKIPDNLTYEQACFVGLGSIAMQGIRNSFTEKGHKVGVIGLGLIGQLTIRILKAFGCEVLGIDLDQEKLSLAKDIGIKTADPKNDDIESIARNFSKNQGLDSVIITAASRDDSPLQLGAKLAKKYGHVVLVGVVPIKLSRKEFFDKELIFIVSHGFGDESLEKNKVMGARTIWSAKENAKEFLILVSRGLVDVDNLITQEFNITEAQKAYDSLAAKKSKTLGAIIKYTEQLNQNNRIEITKKKDIKKGRVNIGFIGAGSFASGYLLPILSKNIHVNLKGVSTSKGINSKNIADKFGFSYATSENKNIIEDRNINCLMISTRHNLHGALVVEGLKKGKVVFVEKPLCIKEEELEEIINTYKKTSGKLMIGFNRRFSPFIIKLNEFYSNRIGPLIINYRINAGYLNDSHWLNDINEGGGRIIGEVCHFVDLLNFITSSIPVKISAEMIETTEPNKSQNLIVMIKFKDNSIGTINYNAIGDTSYPRERIEVFGEDSTCIIDNFRRAEFVRKNRSKKIVLFNRDMGHKNEINIFIDSVINGKQMPLEFREIICSTYTTFKIIDSLKKQSPINIDLERLI